MFGPTGAPTNADLKTMGHCVSHDLPHSLLYSNERWYTQHTLSQGDSPRLPVHPNRRAHLSRRPARHPKLERRRSLPPAQDANNDVLSPRTQMNGPMGPRRRSVPPRTVVRSGAAREGCKDAVRVLAVLWRPARRESPSAIDLCMRVSDIQNQCLGQKFVLNQLGFLRTLQCFQSFALTPDFIPTGAFPLVHWVGMPGCQGVEKIYPAINFI